ncbi:MAG TPA: hypothetical protein VG125_19505 [Pirellulales bacterium]|jgi:hypothetical protein|nr:hypothetical protein [Pirellulales bacterium]
MSDAADTESLLEGIDWSSRPTPTEGLRGELLAKTTRLVRGRARRRRWGVAAGWGLAYAAGLATAWFARPRDNGPPVNRTQASAATQIAANVAPGETPVEDLGAVPPEELRRRVADAPRPEQIRLLRLAGDRYLYGAADVESALDCYRQVIELTPRGDLAKHESGDSWLLAELKSSAAGGDARPAVQ